MLYWCLLSIKRKSIEETTHFYIKGLSALYQSFFW